MQNSINVITDIQISKAVQWIKVSLIILVPIIHVLPETLRQICDSSDSFAVYTFFSEVICHNIGRVLVPSFFIISGYYFFRTEKVRTAEWYKHQLKKRVSSLLIPYILWISITLLAGFLKFFTFEKLGIGNDESYPILSLQSLITYYWIMPANFPLYYIRNLICMVLIAPIFPLIFKHIKAWGLIFFYLLYISHFDTRIICIDSLTLFYFGAGAYLGLNPNILKTTIKTIPIWSITVTLLLFVFTTWLHGRSLLYEPATKLLVPLAIISIFRFGLWITTNEKIIQRCNWFSKYSFFIYAAHSVYIINFLKGFRNQIPWFTNTNIGLLVSHILVSTIAIMICILLYELLKKISPNTLRVLVGGR